MPRCSMISTLKLRLRCSRCNKPMCTDCARQHPVGLRCKVCMKELRSPVYKVSMMEGLRGFAAGAGAAALAPLAVALGLRFFFLGLLMAYMAGERIADAVSWGSGRKRGRAMQWVSVAAIVVGAVGIQAASALFPIPFLNPMSSAAPFLILLGSITAFRRLR